MEISKTSGGRASARLSPSTLRAVHELFVAGQIDAFMDTSELMAFYEQQSDGEFVPVGDTVGKINIGAASLKGNDALHEALLDAFDAIVDDDTYAGILEKWNYEALDIANAE